MKKRWNSALPQKKTRNRMIGRSSLNIEPLEPRQLLAVITEFMASNDTTIVDGDGDSSDWIEIHNDSASVIDLSGWHLTDDAAELNKWQFPNLPQSQLDPGEYLVVFASGQSINDYVDPSGFLHTNFRLGAGGEYLGLTTPTQDVDFEYAPEYPQQQTDVSYGVFPDNLAAGEFFFSDPTPGSENSMAGVSDQVEFSFTDNTFVGSFSLSLSGTSNPNQSIVYTLDGSLPNESSDVYTAPLTISSTTQVRARVIQTGLVAGPVATANYSRLGADVANFSSQLPILLIENFGGGDIPSKDWNQTGQGVDQVERQASAISIFDNETGDSRLDDPAILNSRSGIRTRGAFSTTFPEPQYSLETWDEFDDDTDVSVFGMSDEADWILYAPNPTFDETLMNNQFMLELARSTEVWAPEVQFVEAFVNTDGGDVTMDDHVGLYVWTEKVKRDSGRLDFERFADDGTSGGWLLAINRMDPVPADDPRATPQHFHTPGPNGVSQTAPNGFGGGDDIPQQGNAFINFEHPNGYDINAVQRQAIEDWFADMEDVLYGRGDVAWNDPVNGYAKYIDVDNFIDYYILHNLSRNSDGLLLSMWIYNPDPANGGKLKFGPPWDHDLGSFEGNPTSSTMHRADRLWYDRLFDDPAFVERYEYRWHSHRQGILSDAGMNEVFDRFTNEIGTEAVLRDGVTNLTSRIDTVKSWLSQRAAAIDNATGGAMTVAFTADQTSGTPPLTVQFSDQSSVPGASLWEWDFGDGTTSTLRNPSHTYTTGGFFDVSLTVTGNIGPLTFEAPSFISAFVAGDVDMDGTLDIADVNQFIANWRADTTGLSPAEQIMRGDLNRDGETNLADWHMLRVAWNAQGGRPLDLGELLNGKSNDQSFTPFSNNAAADTSPGEVGDVVDRIFSTPFNSEEPVVISDFASFKRSHDVLSLAPAFVPRTHQDASHEYRTSFRFFVGNSLRTSASLDELDESGNSATTILRDK